MTTEANATLVLEAWGLQGASVERFGSGLINDTFLVQTSQSERFVLQGLNPVFEPAINIDIDALTRHLAEAGNTTQRIVPTHDGQLWAEADGRAWRLSTFVPGVCLQMLHTEAEAREAGRLLGRFHASIRSLPLQLHAERLGVHDTARHLQALRSALAEHEDHRYFAAIEPLSRKILAEAEQLPPLASLPDRLVHGDPKISNLVFDEATGVGVCMIDLDTLTYMPLPLEMGDAFRSWCNPRGEDHQQSHFRLDLFAAAVGGYAEVAGEFVLEEEWRAFLPATRAIMVELAARFARDALNESYFGWNPEAFPDRSTHNQVRAEGQLELERSLAAQYAEAQAIVSRAFS